MIFSRLIENYFVYVSSYQTTPSVRAPAAASHATFGKSVAKVGWTCTTRPRKLRKNPIVAMSGARPISRQVCDNLSWQLLMVIDIFCLLVESRGGAVV